MLQQARSIPKPERFSSGAPAKRTYFARTTVLFCLGLLLALELVDSALGIRFDHGGNKKRIGVEVLEVVRSAKTPGPDVKAIYLGDSVARQMFHPGEEPNRRVRYLASTGAVSLAGQYYLLDDALRNCPAATDVYLLVFPGVLANDLVPPLSHDYFCAFFHGPRQMIEVFAAKKDTALLASQIVRSLWPNLMAENSRNWIAASPSRASFGARTSAPDPEPLFRWCDRLLNAPPSPVRAPPDCPQIVLSPISRAYLPRLRALCKEHGVRLHVLACPCSDQIRVVDDSSIFEFPIVYLSADDFRDGLHFKKDHIDRARELVVAKYGLSQ